MSLPDEVLALSVLRKLVAVDAFESEGRVEGRWVVGWSYIGEQTTVDLDPPEVELLARLERETHQLRWVEPVTMSPDDVRRVLGL